MPIKRRKISELEEAKDLTGFFTIGYRILNGAKKSVKYGLGYIYATYLDMLQAIKDLRGLEATVEENEEERETAEGQRKASEQSRQTAETARGTAETARKNAETGRVNAESARVTAEGKRVTAESSRVTAENNRVSAENTRVSQENARKTAETGRVEAEKSRVTEEGKRVASETGRVNAESARVTEEGKRVTAESSRVTAENNRVSAENTRVSHENARKTAETGRVEAEKKRVTAETERVNAESTRVTEEGKRVTAESSRVTAEKGRVTAEAGRVNAEKTRVTAETERVGAETTRVTEFATIKQNAEAATKNANDAADKANKAADGISAALDKKVDKVSGKGLSTNDYTTAEKTKLSGIATNANNYTHPSATAYASGLYKITTNNQGHVASAIKVVKADITGLGIPAQDTVYTHPVTPGNKHIPAGGSSGQILKWSADGNAVWANESSALCPYGVGDIFITKSSANPATTWPGTTWKKLEGRFLYGTSGSEAVGGTGGATEVALSTANLPAHNHSVSTSISSGGNHSHSTNAHSHSTVSHSHTVYPHYHHIFSSNGTSAGTSHNLGSASYVAAQALTSDWSENYAMRQGANMASVGMSSANDGSNTGSAAPYTNTSAVTVNSGGDHSHSASSSCSNTGSGNAFSILPPYIKVHVWERQS